jgi:hypothetical protein
VKEGVCFAEPSYLAKEVTLNFVRAWVQIIATTKLSIYAGCAKADVIAHLLSESEVKNVRKSEPNQESRFDHRILHIHLTRCN